MSDATTSDTGDTSAAPYQVLARKYRPQNFDTLIGQAALVRTLTNAIAKDRIAHAFMLTGVRGVGKTTTARIIARTLNCIGPDGTGGITDSPCGVCDNCISIAESRHIDVLEMDAASRTGVDDIRELLDGVRYLPVAARFKVYIIDEVHMLSRNAFNALLKTLEEPPEHVKFIFATTEIRKVPVTVLSRCQRFDLRRVDAQTLIAHFETVLKAENVPAEAAALAMIARAAEGSVRDGLSLLDQAIGHGAGDVTALQVREMLGLADRARIFDLFDAVMSGKMAQALDELREQYNLGADPVVVLQDLLEHTHWLTRLKVAPNSGAATDAADEDRARAVALSADLTMPTLTRTWQLLLKGLGEVRTAPMPLAAAEMVLIRLAYMTDLPAPADMIRQLQDGGGATVDRPAAAPGGPARESAPVSAAPAAPAPVSAAPEPPPEPPAEIEAAPEFEPAPDAATPPPTQEAAPPTKAQFPSFEALVAYAGERKEGVLYSHLQRSVRLVRFEPGRLELRPTDQAPANLVLQLTQKLAEWTGERWIVTVNTEAEGAPPLHDQETARQNEIRQQAEQHPLVQAVMDTFPGAKIHDVRPLAQRTVTDRQDDETGTGTP